MAESCEVQLQGNNKRYGHVLNEGEYILLVVRPEFMIPNVLLFILSGFLFLLPALLGRSNATTSFTLLIVVILLVSIALINRWVKMQRYWVLTNQRLFSCEGVIQRKSCLIDLNCITDIATSGGFLSLIIADGKVFVYTAGHAGAALIINSQRNAQQTASYLRAAMINPRQTKILNTAENQIFEPLQEVVAS